MAMEPDRSSDRRPSDAQSSVDRSQYDGASSITESAGAHGRRRTVGGYDTSAAAAAGSLPPLARKAASSRSNGEPSVEERSLTRGDRRSRDGSSKLTRRRSDWSAGEARKTAGAPQPPDARAVLKVHRIARKKVRDISRACLRNVTKSSHAYAADLGALQSLQARRNVTVLLVGANGSGKSTIVRCIAGKPEPTQRRMTVGAELTVVKRFRISDAAPRATAVQRSGSGRSSGRRATVSGVTSGPARGHRSGGASSGSVSDSDASVSLFLWEVPYCELLGGSSEHLGLLLRSADAILFVLDGGDDAGAEAVDDWREVVQRRARAEGTEMVLMTHRADMLPTVHATEEEYEDEEEGSGGYTDRMGGGGARGGARGSSRYRYGSDRDGGGQTGAGQDRIAGAGIQGGARGVRGGTVGGDGSAPIVRELQAGASQVQQQQAEDTGGLVVIQRKAQKGARDGGGGGVGGPGGDGRGGMQAGTSSGELDVDGVTSAERELGLTREEMRLYARSCGFEDFVFTTVTRSMVGRKSLGGSCRLEHPTAVLRRVCRRVLERREGGALAEGAAHGGAGQEEAAVQLLGRAADAVTSAPTGRVGGMPMVGAGAAGVTSAAGTAPAGAGGLQVGMLGVPVAPWGAALLSVGSASRSRSSSRRRGERGGLDAPGIESARGPRAAAAEGQPMGGRPSGAPGSSFKRPGSHLHLHLQTGQEASASAMSVATGSEVGVPLDGGGGIPGDAPLLTPRGGMGGNLTPKGSRLTPRGAEEQRPLTPQGSERGGSVFEGASHGGADTDGQAGAEESEGGQDRDSLPDVAGPAYGHREGASHDGAPPMPLESALHFEAGSGGRWAGLGLQADLQDQLDAALADAGAMMTMSHSEPILSAGGQERDGGDEGASHGGSGVKASPWESLRSSGFADLRGAVEAVDRFRCPAEPTVVVAPRGHRAHGVPVIAPELPRLELKEQGAGLLRSNGEAQSGAGAGAGPSTGAMHGGALVPDVHRTAAGFRQAIEVAGEQTLADGLRGAVRNLPPGELPPWEALVATLPPAPGPFLPPQLVTRTSNARNAHMVTGESWMSGAKPTGGSKRGRSLAGTEEKETARSAGDARVTSAIQALESWVGASIGAAAQLVQLSLDGLEEAGVTSAAGHARRLVRLRRAALRLARMHSEAKEEIAAAREAAAGGAGAEAGSMLGQGRRLDFGASRGRHGGDANGISSGTGMASAGDSAVGFNRRPTVDGCWPAEGARQACLGLWSAVHGMYCGATD